MNIRSVIPENCNMTNTFKIFYSWQSDLPNSTNRTFIEDALKIAANSIKGDDSIEVEPVIDRDTLGVAGSPNIATTILEKIENAHMFVCDVSIINQGADIRLVPNPNVLIELGYALKALGTDRILMVQNIAYGKPDALPFDLKMNRATQYSALPEDKDKGNAKKVLAKKLEDAIKLIINSRDSSFPHLSLKLIDTDGKYKDEIIFRQASAMREQSFRFGFVLQNEKPESKPAEKLSIRTEFYWHGNNIQFSPRFNIDIHNRTTPGWNVLRSGITFDEPAILTFNGTDSARSIFDFPLTWSRFSLNLQEKVKGHFNIKYTIVSVEPHTSSEGNLTITME